LSLHDLLVEDLVHVGAKHPHVEIIVDSTAIDSILKQPEDLLPRGHTALGFLNKTAEDHFAGLEVTIRELVVLDPALRDELTALLDE